MKVFEWKDESKVIFRYMNMRFIIFIFFLVYYNYGFSQFHKCAVEDNRTIDSNRENNEKDSFDPEIMNRDVVYLPLVFHVFNKINSKYIITEKDIYLQLDALNKAFSAKNYDIKNVPDVFQDLISDSGFKFCIGFREVEDGIEKGIEFIETSEDNLGDELLESDNRRRRIKYKSKGGADAWDSDKYINIWVGEMSYALGHSTFPHEDTVDEFKNEAGIIINLNTLPGNYSRGRILVHEMGHYFNLKHIWGSMDENCILDDDVDDTPLQYGPYYGCPIGIQKTCNTLDMYMNYMDYTNDDCSLFFTKGQTERMISALYNYRNRLLDSKDYCFTDETVTNPLNQIKIIIKNDVYIFREESFGDRIGISIYNINGQKLFVGEIEAGQSANRINIVDFDYGMYFVTLEAGKFIETRKFLVL